MLAKRLQEALDDLALFPERHERIEALIALAEEFANDAAVPRDEEHRIQDCESEVYVAAEPMGDGLRFRFGIDNPQGISAMALARLLDSTLSGAPREEVLAAPDDVVYQVFGTELSMGKGAGLIGMVRRVRALAERS